MAATHAESVEAPPSAKQVEELMRVCASLNRALERARWIRLLLLVATVVFVGVACFMFYSLGAELKSEANLEKLKGLAQERLTKNSDTYMKEVTALIEHSSPVVTDAFQKQLKKDLPSYLHAAGQERGKFIEEMQTELAKRLDEHYGKVLDRHEKLIKAEFPKISDDEQRNMMANLHMAVEKLVKKYYVEELRKQLLALYDGWDQFPQSPATAAGEPPLNEQFIGELLELLKVILTENEAPKAA
jgi:vacuolar-type H+-ATPase subunit H